MPNTSKIDTSKIEATLPAVEQNGAALTKQFYAQVARDAYLSPYFNPIREDDASQALALASAIVEYASAVDRDAEKTAAIEDWVHKQNQRNVALCVSPEDYRRFAEQALLALKTVLGAEEAVLEAWQQAYDHLAVQFIARETALYKTISAPSAGGWSGFREFVVVRKETAARSVEAVWFEPVDGKPVLKTLPGQYITIKATTADGITHMRNYSVSSAPSPKGYRITVKAIGAVSKWIHALKVGDKVELRPPMGTLTRQLGINTFKHTSFIAGGTGITPLAAMMLSGIPGTLYYYAHDDQDRPLLAELKALPTVNYVPTKSRPTAEEMAAVPKDSEVICVGPPPFMASVRRLLEQANFPMENAHLELFG